MGAVIIKKHLRLGFLLKSDLIPRTEIGTAAPIRDEFYLGDYYLKINKLAVFSRLRQFDFSYFMFLLGSLDSMKLVVLDFKCLVSSLFK